MNSLKRVVPIVAAGLLMHAIAARGQEYDFDHLSGEGVDAGTTIHFNGAKAEADKALDQQVQRHLQEAEEDKARTANYMKTHPVCYSSDTCFEVQSINGDHYKIKCTKGAYTGSTYCIEMSSGGKWSDSCDSTNFFYHYDSMRAAGNTACHEKY